MKKDGKNLLTPSPVHQPGKQTDDATRYRNAKDTETRRRRRRQQQQQPSTPLQPQTPPRPHKITTRPSALPARRSTERLVVTNADDGRRALGRKIQHKRHSPLSLSSTQTQTHRHSQFKTNRPANCKQPDNRKNGHDSMTQLQPRAHDVMHIALVCKHPQVGFWFTLG